MDADLFKILSDIKTDLAYVKGQLDGFMQASVDHESRLRSLEKFRYSVPGVATLALLVAVVSVVANHF